MKFTSKLCAVLLNAIISLPAYSLEFPEPEVPQENQLTEEKRLLGKILFWDEQLSSDNTVACGTCHIPSSGGADPRIAQHPGPDLIMGTEDDVVGSFGVVKRDQFNQPVVDDIFGLLPQVTGRATPSFFMGIFADSNFWDGRAGTQFFDPLASEQLLIAEGAALENQAIGPILSSVEMGHQDRSWLQVIDKLNNVEPLALATNLPGDLIAVLAIHSDYPNLFTAAFGDNTISPTRIAMAIASYERTLVPDQSPWDLYMAGDETAMTDDQIEGWQLWEQDTVCDNCHKPPLFSDNQFYNIGLRPADEDIGRQEVTGSSADFGRFKTPSLRNAGLKTSLMHVGWITDIQDSVDFYNAETNDTGHHQFTENQTGIPTTNGGTVAYDTLSMFGASAEQQAIIVDFMANALTDPRVANETFPFDRPTLKSERIANSTLSNDLKILTYNVSSTDWTDQVAEVIIEINADIIGIQEALEEQQDDLQQRLGTLYDFYGFSSENNDPILVKKELFKLVQSDEIETVTNCGSPRHLNYVVLENIQSEHWLAFYNAHLCATVNGENIEENQAQAAELIELIAANQLIWPASIIAVGDLNSSESTDTIQFLIEQQTLPSGIENHLFLNDSWQSAFNGTTSKPVPIDWILHAPYSVNVVDAEVFENAVTDTASDHLPLTATVQLSFAYVGAEDIGEDGGDDNDDGQDDNNDPADDASNDEILTPTAESGGGGSFDFLAMLLVIIIVINNRFLARSFVNKD